MRRRVTPGRGELADRLSAFGEIAAKAEGWRPASEVLSKVRAKQTIFPQIDRASRCGGWPIERCSLLHGPSNHGKTILLHGLGLSFLRTGDMYALVDAERTTSNVWTHELMSEAADSPAFVAMRPPNFEAVVDGVRDLVTRVIEGKEKGTVPKDAVGIIGVDSVRKLVPERLLEKIRSEEGGIDGASGRAAMIKAALSAAWLDEIVPLMHAGGFAMVFITRESENTEATGKYDPKFKIQGGKAYQYESSLTGRVTRASWIYKGEKEVVGERHAVQITKTKVGGKDGRDSIAYFHTSNGKLSPEGFDRARDVLDIATRLEIIKLSGSSYSYDGKRLGIGEHAAAKAIREDSALCADLEGKVQLGDGEQLLPSEEANAD